MNPRIEQLSTIVMASCALVLTGLYVADRFGGSTDGGPPAVAKLQPIDAAVASSIDSVALGTQQGSKAVVLTEFIDIECPFCAMFAERLDSAKAILRDTLEIRFANFPLANHRFARSGAAAVECAFQAGRGHEFVSSTYAMQDSLGFWPWERFADAAGVVDTVSFKRCRSSEETESRVARALALTEKLDLRGTPSIFLGKSRYDRPPTLERLVDDIRRLASKLQ